MILKFRAWDEFNECYYYSDIYSNLGDFFSKMQFLIDRQNRIFFKLFTGLKDKNGVEIYFGDILATSNTDTMYDLWTKEDNGYSVVVYDDDLLGVNFSNWEINFGSFETVFDLCFIEVIGNIHENKDLL